MKDSQNNARTTKSDLIASSLLEHILRGEWQVGERIPSVDQLEKILPASRVTISKGIRKLCQQGYLESVWRSGTYVRARNLMRHILLHVGGTQDELCMFPFSMVVTRKLEAMLLENGMHPVIHWESRRPLAGSRLAVDLTQLKYDGLISVQSNLPFMLERDLPALLGRLPTVHIGVHQQLPWVFIDMDAFNRQALQCCRDLQAKQVLYFSPDTAGLDDLVTAAGLTVHTLAPSDGSQTNGLVTEEHAFELFRRAWERLGQRLDAVIVPDDVMAKGIAQALLSLDNDAAKQVQMIALTNKGSGLFVPWPMITIQLDTDEVVTTTVDLLKTQFDQGTSETSQGVAIAPKLMTTTATTPR